MGGAGGGCDGRRSGDNGGSTDVPSAGVGGGVGAEGGGVFTFCWVNTASGERGATCELDD